jgi:hypothetical protein
MTEAHVDVTPEAIIVQNDKVCVLKHTMWAGA